MSNDKKLAEAVIGESIQIEGDLRGDQDLVIQGQVEGLITFSESQVTIGATGSIKADVVAARIIVEGEVRGELRGSESVEIKNSGKVTGDIRSPRVILGDGCQFKGLVDMDYKEAAHASERKRPLKPTLGSPSVPKLKPIPKVMKKP